MGRPSPLHVGAMASLLLPAGRTARQAAVDGMERQAQQAQRFVRQDRSLTPAVCAVVAGPVPSINQCLEGLGTIR